VPQPVIFAAPADVELSPAPIPDHWIVEGTPQARSKRLATSADGTSSVMAWSCTAGRFKWHYTVDETLHVISGEVFVTDEKGDVRRVGAGDMVFFPAGSRSVWHVPEHVRKIAFCRHSMPQPLGYALRVWKKLIAVLGPIFGDEVELDSGLEGRPAVNADRARAETA
jgi:uncharacterized cupin superfamily protein